MRPFVERVSGTIRRRGLPAPGSRVLAGLSGGADSVALVSVLSELGYEVVAAHMNYGLRGAESDRDEHVARQTALGLGVEFHSRRVDTRSEALRGESLEMTCRRLRYRWFEELREAVGAVAVAVAHHREDSVETFVLNAVRGSGVSGLCGIRPMRGSVMRPLIDVSRADIEAYLTSLVRGWADDSTNAGDDFKRNRVRHHVVPALERVDPGAIDGLCRTIDLAAEGEALLTALVGRVRRGYTTGRGLDVRAITAAEDAATVNALVYMMLRGEGLNRSQTDAIVAASALTGVRRFGSSHVLDNGVFREAESADPVMTVSGALPDLGLGYRVISRAEFRPVRGDSSTLYLDPDVLEGDPVFELRRAVTGDRLKPFGMKRGSRLVSDIVREAGIAADSRGGVSVLTRNGVILWVVGVRASRHYAVTSDSAEVIVVSVASADVGDFQVGD